ncbi:hypothetical protein TRIP_C20014 [Candidatus Zixiibacteriota bacterium]|nr:hypothetical protein TRIP_C20014 [candidate division Zixibacteria bacterium]
MAWNRINASPGKWWIQQDPVGPCYLGVGKKLNSKYMDFLTIAQYLSPLFNPLKIPQ